MKAEQAGALPWSAFGVNPISAKIIVSRFDRRMAFVPEGQAERSQARSAWVTMQRGPVRRDGRSHCQCQAEIGTIVPLGRGYFPHDSRHFVPGYYRAVPPGQKPSPIEVPRIIISRALGFVRFSGWLLFLQLRRDLSIELPGFIRVRRIGTF